MKKAMIEFVVRSEVNIPDEYATSDTLAWEYIQENFDELKNQIDGSLDLQYDTIECVEILEEENKDEIDDEEFI